MLSVDKAIREHLKAFRGSRKVRTPKDRLYIRRELLEECIAEKEKLHETLEMKGPREANLGMKVSEVDSKVLHLWEFNAECPECGAPANHTIRACETRLSYCSNECAEKHVNKKEGGY